MPVDALASVLDGHVDFRVLRRIGDMRRGGTCAPHGGVLIGCALDVETTGLDVGTDSIIELAVQRFWADADGRILITGRPRSWREDPGRGLPPEITRLTGISDAQLKGRSIVDPEAACMIADADFVVAHNAAFDRPFVEKRLPYVAGRPWICSMRDMDWKQAGFEGRVLGHLLMQMGWFYEAHRASSDVSALLHLLDHPLNGHRTVLRSLYESARRPGWIFEAVGATFAAKDVLKARGYKWDAAKRLWSREVAAGAFDDEMQWSVMEIYGGLARPRVREVTWSDRYASG